MEILINTKSLLIAAVVAGLVIAVSVRFGYELKRRKIDREKNEGEAAVRRALTEYCRKSTAHLSNNVTLEQKEGTTQIDHILFTQNGILVIETKHYSGWLFANENQKQWTQVLYYVKHRFRNPIFQNHGHVAAVRNLLDFVPEEQIQGVVVFTGNARFKTDVPDCVIQIDELENYVDRMRLGSLTENRLHFCIGRVEYKRRELTGKTDIEHQQYLEEKYGVLDDIE